MDIILLEYLYHNIYHVHREKRTRERREAEKTGTCGYANAKEWMRSVVQSEYVAPNRAKRVMY